MYKQTPNLFELQSDDKMFLIYAIDMALRNETNPVIAKKFEKMRIELGLTSKGKDRKKRYEIKG